MTEASLEQNVTAARHEHLVPSREIHLQDMRGHTFCEVGMITGTSPDNAIANIWNAHVPDCGAELVLTNAGQQAIYLRKLPVRP